MPADHGAPQIAEAADDADVETLQSETAAHGRLARNSGATRRPAMPDKTAPSANATAMGG